MKRIAAIAALAVVIVATGAAAPLGGNLGPYSATVSAKTQVPPPPVDTEPPSAPTNLVAIVKSTTEIDLTWTAATDNVGVTGYRVERCLGAGCSNFAEIASPTQTAYSDSGLDPATEYSYRVRASDETSATPPPPPPPPPPPTSALPCGSSLDAAYDAAAAGTVIELAACSYTGKELTGTKAAPGVIFDLNGSDQGSVAVRASWVEFRDGSLDWYWTGGDGSGVYTPSDHVTFRNIKATGVYIDGGTNISMIGGEIGPNTSDQINFVFDDSGGIASNILFDGVYIRDNSCVSSGCHYEALRIQNGANGVVIRNSVFRRNAIFHIFLTSNGTNYPKNVTMERNCFDVPLGGSSAIAIHDPVLTSVDPALLRFTVKDNFAATGSNFRGPFWVYTGNTFGPASTCDTWIPGRSTP